MQAIMVKDPKQEFELELVQIPIPGFKSDQVLIKVSSFSITFLDV